VSETRARTSPGRPLFTVAEVGRLTGAEVVGQREPAGTRAGDLVLTGVEVDSRLVRGGDLFCALPGERVDGHAFVGAAFDRGALAALVSRDPPTPVGPGRVLLRVPDVLTALGRLARYHRDRYSLPVIGVTGSVGKTTTKDLVASALGATKRVLKNQGNLNTDIGLPLTVFELGPEHEIACLEMGMRGPGEITRLALIARPDIGILTNIGPVHMELLGSLEAIAAAKEELLESLPRNGSAVMNADDPLVAGMADRHRGRLGRVVTYGLDVPADITATDIDGKDSAGVRFRGVLPQGSGLGEGDLGFFSVPLAGRHIVSNALAAVATALLVGLGADDIRRGLMRPDLSAMRQETFTAGGVLVINDAYNAGPASMAAAVKLLEDTRSRRGGRAVAVLGDMLELGDLSEPAHRELGRAVTAAGIDYLVTVGPRSRDTATEAVLFGFDSARVTHFDGERAVEDAARAVLGLVREGDVVLVKASRGMKLERVAQRLATALRDRGTGGDGP